jgi:hypothetical protein
MLHISRRWICYRRLMPTISLALQLLDTEVGAQSLCASTVGVCQVLSVNAVTVSGVADTVTLSSY